MKEPIGIHKESVLLIHERLIAEFGGLLGVRDMGLLESALQRPRNLFEYERKNLADLACAYAFGIAKNHPFLDGNKRVALTVCRVFLIQNGKNIVATQQEKFEAFYGLAAGRWTEKDLLKWLKAKWVDL